MTSLITFTADVNNLRVMFHDPTGGRDAGTALACFGAANLARIQVGATQGEDCARGAYDWWPLTIDGTVVGELRDDATGMTIHVTPQTWMSGVGLLLPADDDHLPFQPPSWEAKFGGRTLGYFATAEEAQDHIDAAQADADADRDAE